MKLGSEPLSQCFHQPLHVLQDDADMAAYQMTRVGTEINGQVLVLYWLINDNCFTQLRFKALGASMFIACVEFICGYLEGRHIKELAAFSSFSILEEQGLVSKQQHVAVLIDQAVRQAIKSYQDDTQKKR